MKKLRIYFSNKSAVVGGRLMKTPDTIFNVKLPAPVTDSSINKALADASRKRGDLASRWEVIG